MTTKRATLYVSAGSGLLNGILCLTKLTVGTCAASGALISDGVHGLADVLGSLVVFTGICFSAKGCDAKHPYGRDRAECIAALLLSVFIGATGFLLFKSGVQSMLCPSASLSSMGGVALLTGIAAVIVKEAMFRITRRVAKKTGSAALAADALHQRTDVLSSLGSLCGVFGAWVGWPLADPLASMFISVFIFKTAWSLFKDAVDRLTDRAADEETQESLRIAALKVPGIVSVATLKTRLCGNGFWAEMAVYVDENKGIKEACVVSDTVQKTLKNAFEELRGCAVHIRPIAVAKPTHP